MDSSIFFAKLLGPYCILAAAGVLFNLKAWQNIMEDFFRNTALIYFAGAFAFLFGLTIVLLHNIWEANWTVIITIFGWLGIIKGVWMIILPNTVGKIIKAYRRNTFILKVNLFIAAVIGLFLTAIGYFAG